VDISKNERAKRRSYTVLRLLLAIVLTFVGASGVAFEYWNAARFPAQAFPQFDRFQLSMRGLGYFAAAATGVLLLLASLRAFWTKRRD
jgi:hypothetical protein